MPRGGDQWWISDEYPRAAWTAAESPEIHRLLHLQPRLGRSVEQLSQTRRHPRRWSARFSCNSSETVSRDTPSRLANSPCVIPSAGSTSSRSNAPDGSAGDWGHAKSSSSSSVIILKVYIHSVLAIEAEGKTQISRYRHGISVSAITFQAMKPIPRQVHVPGRSDRIQSIQHAFDPVGNFRRDATVVPVPEKTLKTTVPELANHRHVIHYGTL